MNKVNQILVAALFAQAAIIAVVNVAGNEPKIAPAAKIYPGFEPDKATKIVLSGPKGTESAEKDKAEKTVTLEKNGTTWGVQSADGYPVEASKVTELLKSIQNMAARGPVVTKTAYHKKLEVADDAYNRKVTITHDGKDETFFIGTSPSFKKVHLRKAGSNDVVLVEGISAWDLGTTGAEWVNKTYFKVPESDVWSLQVKNASGQYALEKGPDNSWALVGAPAGAKLAKSTIDDVVRKAANVTLDELVGKGEKPEQGFGSPSATVTLVTGTSTIAGVPPKTTETKTIVVGAKGEGDKYFVKASGSDYVVRAASWAIDPLVTKGPKDLLEAEKK